MKQGIVLYTDGGARPNPGFAGSGIHGYVFSEEAPKKGAGQGSNILTTEGYVLKSEVPNMAIQPVEVTPLNYIDGFLSFDRPVTNNVAELVGATEALIYAKEFVVDRVLLRCDSEYVRKGLEGWIRLWSKNNWMQRDGVTPVKNKEEWIRLDEARNLLEARGTVVEVKWVKGHNDDLGNELADRLATLGVMKSRSGAGAFRVMELSPADGYWKYDQERHPFIASRNIYFNTGYGQHKPGTYFTGDHGTEDDMFAKRISDGAYAMIVLKEPDPVVEKVIGIQQEMAEHHENLVMMRLDNLFRADTHKEVSAWGSLAMMRNDVDRLDLYCLDHHPEDPRPMTREFRPAKLAWRAVETTAMLEEKLNDYLSKNGKVEATDLTAILYETSEKAPKKGAELVKTMKFNSQFNVGFAALPVEARFRGPDGVLKTAPVILSLGIDMLPRNPLKRLEELMPVVTLITWSDSDDVFRYATVIEADGNVGIWAGVYSNIRVIQKS
jgi:ribonuclease HI